MYMIIYFIKTIFAKYLLLI